MTEQQFRQEAQRLSPTLYRIALSILRSPFDAEDAVQEALEKAWAVCAACRLNTFPAYLMRITVNECRNIQRHRMREQPRDTLPEQAEENALVDTQIDLKNALDTLPDALRTPLLLKYMEGWDDRMIADALSISSIAVRNRLHRARKKLRPLLDEKEAAHET